MNSRKYLIFLVLLFPLLLGLGFDSHNKSADNDFFLDVAKGMKGDHSAFGTFCEREGVAVVATGEDVWQGTAAIIPDPPGAGEQMTIVSTDADDTAAGAGARTMEIMYLDGSGIQQIEELALNGTTGVDTVATDISFVNFFHTDTAGATGVAEGDITIYKKGASSTVYNMIEAGGNMSLTCKLKVPTGKTYYLLNWHATQTGRKPTTVRLRSTDHHGELHPGVYIFKGVAYIDGTNIVLPMEPPLQIPAMSIVKVSAWATDTAGNVSAGFDGVLIDN